MNPTQWSKSADKWKRIPPVRYFFTLYHLFFDHQFMVHRLLGLVYLLQFIAAIILYFYDYKKLKNSLLMVTLPVWGVFMSVSAALTFKFMPNPKVDSGVFTSKSVFSYRFIVENSFFAGVVCFQCLYYNDFIFRVLKSTVIVENIFVFLPYVVRPLWPRTTVRDAIKSVETKESEENAVFVYFAAWTGKLTYLTGKHIFQYHLNYLRFLDRVTEEQIYYIHLLLISFCFGVTIFVFMHTLKIKGYIGPKKSIAISMMSIPVSLYTLFKIPEIFLNNWDIAALSALGIPLNFCSRKVQISYQVLLMVGFNAKRYGLL